MTYMLKLKRAQAAAVINALESIIAEIQEQAGEQEQALAREQERARQAEEKAKANKKPVEPTPTLETQEAAIPESEKKPEAQS